MEKFKKHKNIFAKGLIAVFCSFVLFSCIEDKGNYEYKEINSIEIYGIDTAYYATLGVRFQLAPILKFAIDENQDTYKYEWHFCGEVRTGSYYRSTAVLSEEKVLDIIIGGPIKTDGRFRIMYCVTNLTTGVRYDEWFDLIVRNKMANGYIMLCERENNSFDIDLISVYADTLTQYHNMLDYYDSNLPRAGRTPLGLVCYADGAASPMFSDTYPNAKKYAIWILTDKGTDRVRTENFEWRPEFNISGISSIPEKYLQGDPLVAEKMHSTVANSANNGVNYILFKGNWYWYNWPGNRTYFYMTPINAATSTSTPYKVAPFICDNPTRAAIVFNEDNNRFEWHNSSPAATTASLKTTRFDMSTDVFNWENPNYRLIYMSNRNNVQGFAVVKDVALNRYELLVMNILALNQAPRKGQQGVLPALPGGIAFENIKFFTYCSRLISQNATTVVDGLPYFLCATEDKVYRINTDVMQNWIDVTSLLVPPGHKISMLKNSAVRFAGSNRIVVATYDPNGQRGQNGQLALYDVDDLSGDFTLANGPVSEKADGEWNTELKWTGFGKIINVDYRQPQ